LAGAGIRGSDEPPLLEVFDADVLAASAPPADFDASECPGATAETSPAMPAVNAAAPAMTQRLIRPIRASAASRAAVAPDLEEEPGYPIFELILARENQRPVRAA
jgi:hypothetical protein